jgi:hypothetical protein
MPASTGFLILIISLLFTQIFQALNAVGATLTKCLPSIFLGLTLSIASETLLILLAITGVDFNEENEEIDVIVLRFMGKREPIEATHIIAIVPMK